MICHDDMARLLTAKVKTTTAHPFDNIAITDSSAFKAQPLSVKVAFKPKVRHDSGHKRVALKAPFSPPTRRHKRHELITVAHFAVFVD